MLIVCGCGPAVPGDSDSDSGGGASGGLDGMDPPATGDGGAPLTHGFVKVELLPREDATESPFTGTAGVSITMAYGPCLSAFYENNPSYGRGGIDGASIFGPAAPGTEGWLDRLCEPADAGQASCTVSSFGQELDAAQRLTVTFMTQDVDRTFLKFGPLPLIEALPELECEGTPLVRVDPLAVFGTDASGERMWEGEAVSADVAAPGQERELAVRVRPTL